MEVNGVQNNIWLHYTNKTKQEGKQNKTKKGEAKQNEGKQKIDK